MYLNATSICSTLEIASTIINIDLTLAKLFVHKDKGIDTKNRGLFNHIYSHFGAQHRQLRIFYPFL